MRRWNRFEGLLVLFRNNKTAVTFKLPCGRWEISTFVGLSSELCRNDLQLHGSSWYF